MIRNQACKGRAFRIAVGIAMLIILLLAVGANAVPSESGNRVWDESKNLSTTYTWNSFSFTGFYYDLDNNLTTEELTISNINSTTRTIKEGDINYSTSPIEVSFDYSSFGKYQVIGFMADKYFAGYTVNSVISKNKEMSTIENGILPRVLFDDQDSRVISVGGTLTLGDGYVLKMKEINVGGGPGQVLIGLLKDGVEVDSSVIEGGKTYVYSKQVGGISDLPIIAAHVDSVFRGTEANAVFIKGLFQISESYTEISSGNRYDAMEITAANKNQITMDNRNAIDLSPGNTIDLMGNLKIIVADNTSVLRFALSVERTGTYEVRGTIYPVTSEWMPLNFGLNIGGGTSVGFYYDMDKGIGTEDLKIGTVSGTSIPKGELTYSTSLQEINFEYSGFGTYNVIGFMADKYFAGYTTNSTISKNKKISTIGSGQLQKILLDDKDQRVASEGGTITLKEGYVLKIKQVDIGPGPGQVWVSLLKNGTEVDSGVIAGGGTYVYLQKVGSVSDLPLIAVHFDSVFRGIEVNAAFTRGVFQISSEITSVKSGDIYGPMEISSVGTDGIKMDNSGSIGLSPGGTLDLMGNIKFKVANSSELRFYPFVLVTPEMVANQLVIEAPANATAGDTIKITVSASGVAVGGASVTIGNATGLTDMNGVFNYTLPRELKGTYNITATKLGYQRATKSIEVQGFVENRLSIEAPAVANQFEEITIRVTYNGTAVSGANITYDNTTIGLTDSKGMLNYTLKTSGTHTIYASKSGYVTAARDIAVRVPFSEFRALDINITPNVVSTGQNIVVRSNITNAGTKKDTLPVALLINSTEVDNKSVTLAPSEVKEINFTHKIALSAGNYTVEILGQRGSIEVIQKTPSNGVAVAIGAIIFIYLLNAKRQKDKKL